MASLPTGVLRLLKFALFAVIFYVLMTLVMLIGSGDTGPWEKAVLGVVAAGVYALSIPAHRIGDSRT